MEVDDEPVYMLKCFVLMQMAVRFRPFPAFVLMQVMLIMHMPMHMLCGGMGICQNVRVMGRP